MRGIVLLLLPALICSAAAGLPPAPAHAQSALQPTRSPRMILGRRHPGKITSLSEEGVTVDLKDGGAQVVQFGEIWRIRRAFASDEPPGTTVVDFADNRLFVATPVATLVGDVSKKIALVQFTAPNGEIIYIAASKVTDIFNALPGLHNPLSKTVIGTRDGTQQITEPAGDAKRMVADAHTVP
ncbi:MAG: hypothetical protein ACLPX9_07455 [Rhodomicrobium sp.]